MSKKKVEDLSTLEAVAIYLKDAGYSFDEIVNGVKYAKRNVDNWNDWDEVCESAISRIMYSDIQLNEGDYAQGVPGHVKTHLEWRKSDYDR